MEELYSPSKSCARAATRFGLALTSILLVTYGIAFLIAKFAPQLSLLSSASLYLVAMPIGYLIVRKLPKHHFDVGRMKFSWFLAAFCVCLTLTVAGNIIGTGINALLSSILGSPVSNPVTTAITGTKTFGILALFVLLPAVFEELFFRKVIIDRMAQYGKGTAIIFSAIVFALFHGNFTQLFYALFVGLLLGYVYIKTRNIVYPILLHGLINFFGSVVALWASNAIVSENMLPFILASLYRLLYFGALICGIVFLVYFLVRLRRSRVPIKPQSAAFFNLGIIPFYLCVLALFTMNVIALST